MGDFSASCGCSLYPKPSPAHSKQEAVGLSQKMQRSLLMPESKAANISKQKIRKGGHNEWRIHFCPVLSDSGLPI